MGNVEGSIHYNSSDNQVEKYLISYAHEYNLEIGKDYGHIDKNQKNFGVGVSGLALLWMGQDLAMRRIDSFLHQMKVDLINMGFLNVVIHGPYILPL